MQKLTPIRWLIVTIVAILVACSSSPEPDNILPTLAQLPTTPPSSTSVPSKQSTPSPIPDIETTSEILESTMTNTTFPIPPTNQPIVFPTLVAGIDMTLQGRLTVTKGQQPFITDDVGERIMLNIDDFAAQTANGKVVQISGTVQEEAEKMIVQVIGIVVIEETPLPPFNNLPTPLLSTEPAFLVTPEN